MTTAQRNHDFESLLQYLKTHRGFDFTEPSTFGEYQLTYRSGDMVVPRLEAAEPLGLELEDFARAITTGRPPRSGARLGVEIVRILDAAHVSLTSSGQPVPLGAPAEANSLPSTASVHVWSSGLSSALTSK